MPSPMSKKKQASLGGSALAYLIACRPWTFTASVVPMVLTAVLRQASLFSKTFGCALLSGILVHAASNLTNTYFDFVSGRDTKDESGDRSLVDRTVSQQGVLILSAVLYLLSVLAASVVLPSSSQGTLIMVFLAGVLLSFFYTAGPFSLKCMAMGDVVIFVCFGPLLMQFTALLLDPSDGSMQWDLLPYMLPLGLLTEGILHANNTRDIAMDTKAGIITLAGLIGFDASRALFVAMLALSYISSLWLALTQYYGNALVLLTLPIALNLVRTFQPKGLSMMPENVAKLHCVYGGLTILGVALSQRFPLQ